MTPRERAAAAREQAWDLARERSMSRGVEHHELTRALDECFAAIIHDLEEEVAWLRRLLTWCSFRLRHKDYELTLQRNLEAGPKPAPKDEPPIIQSDAT
jgi:hypothetical protein